MTQDSLFPDAPFGPAPDPVDGLTSGQALRARQAARIRAGMHPLAYLDPGARLHPLAARVTEPDGRGNDPYRCGSCRFLAVVGGHARGYPKCMFGRTETPVPVRLQTPHGPRVRISTPRATGALASDLRRWWPACISYLPLTAKENDMTAEPTQDGPQDWLFAAVERLLLDGVAAEFEDEPRARQLGRIEALKRFAETAREETGLDEEGAERTYLTLAGTLAQVAHDAAPDEWRRDPGGAPLALGAFDVKTGAPIHDIDEDIAATGGGEWERGNLAAVRFYIAQANHDLDTAFAVFRAAGESDEGSISMILSLLQMASYNAADDAYKQGRMPETSRPAWEARLARDEAEAPPEPATFERDGRLWTRFALDPDVEPEEVMPHGTGPHAVGVYVPGMVSAASVARLVHQQIVDAMRDDDPPLCGVMHWEEVQVWQLPKSQQVHLNRGLRDVQREYGRPGAFVRAWQHTYRCEESLSDAERRAIPGPDDIPLFEDPELAAELAALTNPADTQ